MSSDRSVRHISHASARRDPVGSYVGTGGCTHNPENINCERVTEEARYCTVLLLQQHELVFINMCTRNLEF